MIKVLFLIKRKPGITPEEFREHYERSHVRMAQRHFGHLLIGYERNYPGQVRTSRSQGRGPAPFDYDVITEWLLEDEEALEAVYRTFDDPEVGREFFDDEGRFMDRDSVISITCSADDVVDTGTTGPDA